MSTVAAPADKQGTPVDPAARARELTARLASLEPDYARACERVEELRAAFVESKKLLDNASDIATRMDDQILGLREELASLPKVQERAPEVTREAGRQEVLEQLTKFGTFQVPDIAAVLRIKKQAAQKFIDEFIEAGVVNDTGVKFGGAKTFEFIGVAYEREEEAEAVEVPVEPQVEKTPLQLVRDFVVQQEEPFGPTAIIVATGVTGETLTECMEALEKRSIVTKQEGAEIWEYQKAQVSGRAAMLDQQRRVAESFRTGAGSAPVGGTGRKMPVSHPEVRSLIDAVTKLGASVTHAPNGHYAVAYDGKRVVISATPSSNRSVMNDRARIRRVLGLGL